jgi:hypothetical protein
MACDKKEEKKEKKAEEKAKAEKAKGDVGRSTPEELHDSCD